MMGRHQRLPIDSLFDFEGSDCSHGCKFVLFSTRDGPDLSEGLIKYTYRSESIHLMILEFYLSWTLLRPLT
jgi:hypothetical protein